MRIKPFAYVALIAAMMPTATLADDPRDPTMRDAAARARDREMVRQLNLEHLAMVRERDARFAEGWRAYRNRNLPNENELVPARSDYERAVADHARGRARYEREMAQWRRAVVACRAGDYSACDN